MKKGVELYPEASIIYRRVTGTHETERYHYRGEANFIRTRFKLSLKDLTTAELKRVSMDEHQILSHSMGGSK